MQMATEDTELSFERTGIVKKADDETTGGLWVQRYLAVRHVRGWYAYVEARQAVYQQYILPLVRLCYAHGKQE